MSSPRFERPAALVGAAEAVVEAAGTASDQGGEGGFLVGMLSGLDVQRYERRSGTGGAGRQSVDEILIGGKELVVKPLAVLSE